MMWLAFTLPYGAHALKEKLECPSCTPYIDQVYTITFCGTNILAVFSLFKLVTILILIDSPDGSWNSRGIGVLFK